MNPVETNHKCDYGCGRQANFINPKSGKFCCESNFGRCPHVKKKRLQTNLDRYGFEHPAQRKEVQDKKKQTTKQRYGFEHAMQSDLMKTKRKQSNLKKHGVDEVLRDKSIKLKAKETLSELYGVDNPMKLPMFKEKRKRTCQERFGADNPMQTKEVQEKKLNSLFERYGVDHPMDVPEFNQKRIETMKKNKTFNISKAESSWLDRLGIKQRQVHVQGAEKCWIVDGFEPETKTVYEFNGDFWHGNPSLFEQDELNRANKKTFGELFKRTIFKKTDLEKAGYQVISIWESEWNMIIDVDPERT